MASLLWSTKVVINGVPSALFAATVRYDPYTLPQIYPLLAWIAYFIGGMLLYDVYLKNFVTGSKQRASLTWAVTGVSLVVVAIGMYFLFQMDVPGWLRSTGHTGYWWQQNIALHSTLSALGFVVFFLAIAALWKHFLGEGPMERLVARNIDLAVPAGKKA